MLPLAGLGRRIQLALENASKLSSDTVTTFGLLLRRRKACVRLLACRLVLALIQLWLWRLH
jgi:hypothetical protein